MGDSGAESTGFSGGAESDSAPASDSGIGSTGFSGGADVGGDGLAGGGGFSVGGVDAPEEAESSNAAGFFAALGQVGKGLGNVAGLISGNPIGVINGIAGLGSMVSNGLSGFSGLSGMSGGLGSVASLEGSSGADGGLPRNGARGTVAVVDARGQVTLVPVLAQEDLSASSGETDRLETAPAPATEKPSSILPLLAAAASAFYFMG